MIRIQVTAELMPDGMGSLVELMPVGMGTFSEPERVPVGTGPSWPSLCLLA